MFLNESRLIWTVGISVGIYAMVGVVVMVGVHVLRVSAVGRAVVGEKT